MAEVFLKNSAERDFATEEWDRLCARDPSELAVAEIDRVISVGDLIHQARMRAGQFIACGVGVQIR